MTAVLRRFLPRAELRKGDKHDAWKAGTGGQNSLTRIWTWSDIDNRAGVMAQELYEWRWSWLWRLVWGLGAGLPVFVLLWLFLPVLWPVSLLVGVMSFVLGPQLHFMQRRKELMSQEIETQVAALFDGTDAAAYRRRDIGRSARRDLGGIVAYPWFERWDENQIQEAMMANSAKARAWIAQNEAFLRRVHRFEMEE